MKWKIISNGAVAEIYKVTLPKWMEKNVCLY